ncbi:MAG: DUF6259 domain-containing protein [Terracidiphilus sp.]|nr:DUF6259 domain-containing protein [Terracidiphilus sp.]MDR3796624.1 DUF6259 domain-containing protein [Terracidiphilus sp.]
MSTQRSHLIFASLMIAAGGLGARQISAQPSPDHAQIRTIETPIATLRLSETNCDLIGLRWKSPELEVIGEPRLGENFRILIPQKGYEANYFTSRDQKVDEIDAIPGGVVCTYDALHNDRETLPVKVRYRIEAVETPGAGGQIHFSIEVENPTDRELAEVMYGIIGGQKGIGDRLDTESMIPGANNNLSPVLFTRFRPGFGGGNFGIPYDAVSFTYPGAMPMGWMDIYNVKAGLGYYYANQDPDTRLMLLQVELRPYSKGSDIKDNWPGPSELPAGEPVGLSMGWVNMPYLKMGTFKAGPLALEVHKGDWHQASGIYRAWFDQHFTVRRTPDWLRKENAWQSIIISNPEDVVLYRFNDLPRLAADAKKYGITTFEILGWDIGGIDRGYPQYTPDPRLGTEEEFRSALAEIRDLGVHPLIFTNVDVADTATPLFKDKLKDYVTEGRWAPDWQMFGWGYGTMSARGGLTPSKMALVSPSHPEFRKFEMDEYMALVRDGAEGFQIDKSAGSSALDFNKQLTVSPDKSMVPGILETFNELLSKARAITPDFSLAAETWSDRAMPYVDVSYMRMGAIDIGSPVLKYTFPEWTATIFGEAPGDFNQMNNGMRYGFVWDLAARHYNASVDEPLTRPLARYVSELIRIRKQYADLLFLGRFNDTMGATVHGGANIRYSVFKPLQAGMSGEACVVVNFDTTPQTVSVSLDGVSGNVQVATPFHADRTATLPVRLTIPPHQLAVVVKQ